MKYLIFADVSTDIDLSFVEEGTLKFIPMEYSLGDNMRECHGPENRDLLKQFYDGQRNGDLTRTSQISPYNYEEFLTPFFEEGYSALYLSLSSGLSSTFQSALVAKASLEEKFEGQFFMPVDSLAATGGMGVLTERALKNQKSGMSLMDNYEDLVAASHKIKHWFLVQDLMYLKRGGRVSATTAVVGTALNIVPILKIDEIGKLENFAKKRGTKLAANALIEYFKETYDSSTGDAIYIVDADNIETGDYIKDELLKLYPDAKIRRTGLSPIIGAHTGPGMVAVCHIGK